MSTAATALGNTLSNLGDTLGASMRQKYAEERAMAREQALLAREDAIRREQNNRQDALTKDAREYEESQRLRISTEQRIAELIRAGYLQQGDAGDPAKIAEAEQRFVSDAVLMRTNQTEASRLALENAKKQAEQGEADDFGGCFVVDRETAHLTEGSREPIRQ